MRQAIVTKYLAPTNNHDARVKATCDAGSVTLPWNYGADTVQNHEDAALLCAARYGWGPLGWHGGGVGNGYVWVQVST